MKRLNNFKGVGLLLAAFLCGPLAARSQDGLLIIAHGSSKPGWNELVLRTASQVHWQGPLEVAFLMQAPSDRTLDKAVARLDQTGVQRMIVVPLLVSSFSGHYEEIRYYAGKRKQAPAHAHHSPLKTPAEVVLTSAMDDHPLVSEILLSHARSLSEQPNKETLILVAHGPNDDAENEKWLEHLRPHGDRIRKQLGFRRVEIVTLRDDAPQPVRDAATEQLRRVIRTATTDSKALILPVLISVGDIQRKIRQRLDGLVYEMSEQGLMEHSLAAEWIRQQAVRAGDKTSARVQSLE